MFHRLFKIVERRIYSLKNLFDENLLWLLAISKFCKGVAVEGR
jgi:hypothetical protein